jgi:hypothetical protein
MKGKKNKPAKRRETWTFQPSADVLELVRKSGITVGQRGERTNLINAALRNMARHIGANEQAAIYRALSDEFLKRAKKAESQVR